MLIVYQLDWSKLMNRCAVIFTSLAMLIGAASFANAQTFSARLDGQQEVPPNASPGTGFMTGTLSGGPGNWTFTYTGSFSGLISPVRPQPAGGHIHVAPAGVNGPVVHPLVNLDTGVMAGSFSGTWTTATGLTDDRVTDLLTRNLYVNIHTDAFPGGEIRGQIIPEPSAIVWLGLCSVALFAQRRRKV